MVESVDTRDLKSLGVRAVWVQVPLRLPWEIENNQSNKQCRINHRKVVFLLSNISLSEEAYEENFPSTRIPNQFFCASTTATIFSLQSKIAICLEFLWPEIVCFSSWRPSKSEMSFAFRSWMRLLYTTRTSPLEEHLVCMGQLKEYGRC